MLLDESCETTLKRLLVKTVELHDSEEVFVIFSLLTVKLLIVHLADGL